MSRTRAFSMRRHIVLIPGFGGFNALGQVEYYTRVTPLFEKWVKRRPGAVLHYFDSLPTAAVGTRAQWLGKYLARRIARGDIAPGDKVSLVGHSTGGLDIRCLIAGLTGGIGACEQIWPYRIDSGSVVDPPKLLACIRRVVFLSVPHWGTNIANWVQSHKNWREAVVAKLRADVAGSRLAILDQVEEELAGGWAALTGAEILLAIKDSLGEVNEYNGARTPTRRAEARQASSELGLYLRQIAADFGAIDDLASEPDGAPLSPAHFTDRERKEELRRWRRHRIQALSFATLGSRPFPFPLGQPAPVWKLSEPCTFLQAANGSPLSRGTDIAYRVCYRACAGGPFVQPRSNGRITRWLGRGPIPKLELWDNDGIVNTASMLWPEGQNVLVPGDHLDIVGHYHRLKAKDGEGRQYQAYDALRSTPRFRKAMFARVWREILDFCG